MWHLSVSTDIPDCPNITGNPLQHHLCVHTIHGVHVTRQGKHLTARKPNNTEIILAPRIWSNLRINSFPNIRLLWVHLHTFSHLSFSSKRKSYLCAHEAFRTFKDIECWIQETRFMWAYLRYLHNDKMGCAYLHSIRQSKYMQSHFLPVDASCGKSIGLCSSSEEVCL